MALGGKATIPDKCKDQSNQTKKAYTVFYLSEGVREGKHLKRKKI